ncbi:TIM barrel protein [Lentisphaera profundi]|uniref:TIM barrel protein n=1 Tax=Lentisphaera profundi TaxID=1658616 RepID=A0ABY7VMV8_9BACT|nr:TIM barrel protein [Lentisphaera profundi]WDE95385.1 TIM barrel protein [Lentisphaera profundi]
MNNLTLRSAPGVQLFSFRDEMENDLEGTLKRLRKMGVTKVEACFGGADNELIQHLKAMDFEVPSVHLALGSRVEMDKNYTMALDLGADYIVTGSSPHGAEDFKDIEAIKKLAKLYSREAQEAADRGLRLSYHNHDWEMKIIEGRYAFEYLLEECEGSLAWEWDVYWSLIAGADLHEVQKILEPICSLLHLKDGNLIKGEKMCALGQGNMPFNELADFMAKCEHVFIELDEYEGCLFKLVQESMDFLD